MSKLCSLVIAVCMTKLKGMYFSMQLWTDLLKPGFNDGVPVFDGCDRVWMADGQNSLPHSGCFIESHSLFLQFLHELLKSRKWKGV